MKIRTKRVEGFGKGSTMNFPTINIQLPLGSVELGLWSILTHFGPAMGLFSNYSGMIRGEIHVLDLRYNLSVGRVSVILEPGKELDIEFISKLRDPIKIKNIEEAIQADKKLAHDFWKGVRTCEACERCYSQDYGYSNWTVEGTNYGCYANVWEEDGNTNYFERYLRYGAITCPYFVEGDMWTIDVDGQQKPPSEDWFQTLNRDLKLIDLLKRDKL